MEVGDCAVIWHTIAPGLLKPCGCRFPLKLTMIIHNYMRTRFRSHCEIKKLGGAH